MLLTALVLLAANPDPVVVNGVVPQAAVVADHVPVRTEAGIGALMPWAGRLWYVGYVAHTASTGGGTGLYEMDETLRARKHAASVVGTYANRLVHGPSNQLSIGPHLIDVEGKVRTIDAFKTHRLTATMTHLTDPKNKLLFLTMEGLLFEVDVRTLATQQLMDVKAALGVKGRPHFKGGYTGFGRLVVANNSYEEADELGTGGGDGRLAEWDGKTWTILERTAFCDVTGNGILDTAIFATGWDRASAIFKVFTKGAWTTYRLPKGSLAYDHAWFTEWPRIREVETERFLMDVHGIFYELPAMTYGGRVRGIQPISNHLRMVPDFTSWRGFLVLAGNQTSSMRDRNHVGGQPQAGLWLGKTDDLWSFGKPRGWGGPWRETAVKAGVPSVPYLMTGFDRKVLHLMHDANTTVRFRVEVDVVGDQSWRTFETVSVPARALKSIAFPPGFGAHWVRVVADRDCSATAQLSYD